MGNQLQTPVRYPAGEVIAVEVSLDEFMAGYEDDKYEWINGAVIRVSPASTHHLDIHKFLIYLLDAYLAYRPLGKVYMEKLVMRLENSAREPDLVFIRNENLERLSTNALLGPADICIEVVSPESIGRDYGEKFAEYEAGGVAEYWIIDPKREQAKFHRLNANGIYEQILPNDNNYFTTPLLPDFKLHIPTLWVEELPNLRQAMELVETMLAID